MVVVKTIPLPSQPRSDQIFRIREAQIFRIRGAQIELDLFEHRRNSKYKIRLLILKTRCFSKRRESLFNHVDLIIIKLLASYAYLKKKKNIKVIFTGENNNSGKCASYFKLVIIN